MNVYTLYVHVRTSTIEIPMHIYTELLPLHDTPDHCTVCIAVGSHVTVPFDHMPSTYVQVYMNGMCNSEKFSWCLWHKLTITLYDQRTLTCTTTSVACGQQIPQAFVPNTDCSLTAI